VQNSENRDPPDTHTQNALQTHAAALLKLSYVCKELETAEEIKKIAHALLALAMLSAPNRERDLKG
jgi:hypothetical protein